jgi:hypothetical protein
MNPFECYTAFLCLKQHFTKKNYDIFKYNWKSRASLKSFYKRKDRYFFEKLSRHKSSQQIKEFLISNFVSCSNPQSLYISDIMEVGDEVYVNWQKRIQSLSYNFKSELEPRLNSKNFNKFFEVSEGNHSPLIQEYLRNSISIETLVILNQLLNFSSTYDKVLMDPVWDFLGMRILKYSPFLNIEKPKYIQILKELMSE